MTNYFVSVADLCTLDGTLDGGGSFYSNDVDEIVEYLSEIQDAIDNHNYCEDSMFPPYDYKVLEAESKKDVTKYFQEKIKLYTIR